jgi:DNA-directed RNA polymerase specialized sigma24 family protein
VQRKNCGLYKSKRSKQGQREDNLRKFFERPAALRTKQTSQAPHAELRQGPDAPGVLSRPAPGEATRGELPAGQGEVLLARMRGGDREAVAQFLGCYGPYIRRRVRGKITPGMRRLFDSQELLSTLGRRLDRYVQSGRFKAVDDPQFWRLIFRMVDNAVLDKHRIIKRLECTEGEDSPLAKSLLARLRKGEADPTRDLEWELEQLLRVISAPVDRQIISFWLMGHSLRVIAAYVDLSPEGVRQRWLSIRLRLRECLENRT